MRNSVFSPRQSCATSTKNPGNRLRRSLITLAREFPDSFATCCFTDPSGRALEQGAIHVELQQFLTDHRHALIELPRDHGKSTQICARIVWELGRDPSLRIKVVCSSEAIAKERGRFMMNAIAHNPYVRQVFPKLRAAQPWTADRFTVRRDANIMGPSVTAIGVGSSLTGTRADILVCDDIVDVKSIRSRAERERAKSYFRDNLMNLLEPHGKCWALFTPWHNDDLNAELKRNGNFDTFTRRIDARLNPIWPERWPQERLQARRQEIGATSFARGYRLQPMAEDDLPIHPDWVRYWTEDEEMERIILSIDPAVSTHEKADFSALVVLGLTDMNRIHCLEAKAYQIDTPKLVRTINECHERWRPQTILFESNAAFKGIKDLLVQYAEYGPKIKAITQVKSKGCRVAPFAVSVENGSFRLKGSSEGGVDPGQQALLDQMLTFPVAEHDDLLDATVTGVKYLLEKREPRIWTL